MKKIVKLFVRLWLKLVKLFSCSFLVNQCPSLLVTTVSWAKRLNRSSCRLEVQTRQDPCQVGVHIGATWQMRLNDRAQGRNFIPPPLSDVATLPWEIQKSHFFHHYYSYTSHYFRYLGSKTNSNCCTAALAIYLLLFNASYYLHSPSTASGADYRRIACWYGHVEACGSGLLQHGLNFSTAWCTMDWSVSKKTESMY